jgi:uncharacterized membrane protein YeiH
MNRNEDKQAYAAVGIVHWISFAAAPTFAFMALLTSVFGGGSPDMLCSAGVSPLSGMAPMYLLMSIFHSAPWLKRILRRFEILHGNK